MADYLPLALGRHCNTGVRFAGPGLTPPLGRQRFRGLPFQIGARPGRCFLGFGTRGGGRRPVTVPVGRRARHVVFAHTLLETRVWEGEAPGRVIAHYVFSYRGGTPVRVPIRERFEINVVPTPWGMPAFLALPDQADSLAPRTAGNWDQMGERLTEAIQAWPRAYWLWAWSNPDPDRPLAAITIEPADRRFLVAAVTLGLIDEPPFARTGRRAVKITLPRRHDAARPFGLTVAVDRGTATYPWPLPEASARRFLAADRRGFGEPFNSRSSPAYVEIAASPSATVSVANHGRPLGRATWGELERRGKISQRRVELELVDHGRNWVQVSVVDDATGRPVPCRVHFRSPTGIPYQPHGHHDHVVSNLHSWHNDIGGDLRLGQITYAYIDGRCQGWLPRGEVLVDVARGFEYEPLRTRVRIGRGQRELTLRLRRWTDMNARRWFSGDTHVHFLGTQGAHREAQGEDLNVVNLLQSQWGHLFTNTEDWLGRPTVSEDGRTIVYANQENRQHVLGHLTLLGLKRPVMPWCSDGPSEAELGGTIETTLAHWADACHAQGGTVVIPHMPLPNCEPAVLIATGRTDAVELVAATSYPHLEYYRYLNCGYRLPLVGGTDKMSSDVPVGLYRTYAQLGADQEFTYDHWLGAVRAGRTFLSSGPLLEFTVDGARIGDTVRLPGRGGTVEVVARAESIFPIHTLQIIQQGRVVADTASKRGTRRLALRAKVAVSGHTWFAARCGGPGYNAQPHYDCWRRGVLAHTSPVYVAVGGDWRLVNRDTLEYMLTLTEGGLRYLRERAPHHPRGHDTHHHREVDHQAYLERPFHEARAALHRRLHALGVDH